MPYPQNFETAKGVEDIVRKEGAVPATIAILDGVIRIGERSQQRRAGPCSPVPLQLGLTVRRRPRRAGARAACEAGPEGERTRLPLARRCGAGLGTRALDHRAGARARDTAAPCGRRAHAQYASVVASRLTAR
jgi:hypothetical protein